MALAPPNASPLPPDGSATMDSGGGMDGAERVVLTICRAADGSWRLYTGDEPDGGTAAPGDDMSEDDADALGPAGAAPPGAMGGGGSGQSADNVGAALKIAMDIMQADGGGGPADADAQFAAGYSSDKAPTPMGMGGGAGLKYPPS